MADAMKEANGNSNEIDSLSDLPDAILHHVISFLGTKQACRTSILSIRWVNIWSTGFVLDFNPCMFGKVTVTGRENAESFVSFIETTMQRYSDQNLSIRKMSLDYRDVDKVMMGKIDRWLQIAVENQVEDLSLSIKEKPIPPDFLPSYIPVVLFSAKSLISLTCFRARVPRCSSVMLMSLQSLDLSSVDIDEDMLQHIIMFCPLKKLCLQYCFGIGYLSIPNCSKLELLHVRASIPSGGSIKLETSTIKNFSYSGDDEFDPWCPFKFSLASKKNLSELSVSLIRILDNVIDKLVSELSLIRTVSFYNCKMPQSIRIKSLTLERLVLEDYYDLTDITLDAPQFKTFYHDFGYLQLSSVTSTHCFHLKLTADDVFYTQVTR